MATIFRKNFSENNFCIASTLCLGFLTQTFYGKSIRKRNCLLRKLSLLPYVFQSSLGSSISDYLVTSNLIREMFNRVCE